MKKVGPQLHILGLNAANSILESCFSGDNHCFCLSLYATLCSSINAIEKSFPRFVYLQQFRLTGGGGGSLKAEDTSFTHRKSQGDFFVTQKTIFEWNTNYLFKHVRTVQQEGFAVENQSSCCGRIKHICCIWDIFKSCPLYFQAITWKMSIILLSLRRQKVQS